MTANNTDITNDTTNDNSSYRMIIDHRSRAPARNSISPGRIAYYTSKYYGYYAVIILEIDYYTYYSVPSIIFTIYYLLFKIYYLLDLLYPP